MKKLTSKPIIVLAALSLLIFIYLSSSTTEKITLDSDAMILAFGDSLTQGVGASSGNSYPEVLARELGVKVINSGISGETSAEGLARLENVLRESNPDLVILFYGGNDILKRQPIDQLKSNLKEMIIMIKAAGSEILLVGVPQPSLSLSTLPLYGELSDSHNIVSELSILGNLLGRPSLKSDQVHLNDEGYKALALAISKKIELAQ